MDEKKEKQDLELLLSQGCTVQFSPSGTSMYPTLVGGRDMAVVAPVKDTGARRGQVLLYRRPESILVLHRVVRVTKDGVYFVGDNQCEVEGPLRETQIRGCMVGFIRKGKQHTTAFLPYRMFSALWLFFLPLRPLAWKFTAFLRKVF